MFLPALPPWGRGPDSAKPQAEIWGRGGNQQNSSNASIPSTPVVHHPKTPQEGGLAGMGVGGGTEG